MKKSMNNVTHGHFPINFSNKNIFRRKIYVVAGQTELSDVTNSTQWTIVVQKIRRKWYNRITLENDIAILKVP